ncbi:MAG: MBL fold metallo-hydrolase [Candidatus Doudnabacteria bacterium]|nr:MBL fold metallo-hydrolase [Candidatus Doudnabacteria bacterium]
MIQQDDLAGCEKFCIICGWGSGKNLLRAGYGIQKLDHIFITHPHADHLGSLISLLHSMLNPRNFFPKTRRAKPLYLSW